MAPPTSRADRALRDERVLRSTSSMTKRSGALAAAAHAGPSGPHGTGASATRQRVDAAPCALRSRPARRSAAPRRGAVSAPDDEDAQRVRIVVRRSASSATRDGRSGSSNACSRGHVDRLARAVAHVAPTTSMASGARAPRAARPSRRVRARPLATSRPPGPRSPRQRRAPRDDAHAVRAQDGIELRADERAIDRDQVRARREGEPGCCPSGTPFTSSSSQSAARTSTRARSSSCARARGATSAPAAIARHSARATRANPTESSGTASPRARSRPVPCPDRRPARRARPRRERASPTPRCRATFDAERHPAQARAPRRRMPRSHSAAVASPRSSSRFGRLRRSTSASRRSSRP